MEILYYDGSTGPVFALKDDAEHVAAVNNALNTAKTWGEYRSLLPAGEWEAHGETFPVLYDTGELVMKDGKPVLEYLEDQEDDDPFDPDNVPGVGDGDYPIWLQQVMLDWMPESILEKYGKHYGTRLNGDSVEFKSEDLGAIIEELRALEYTVTESEHELI